MTMIVLKGGFLYNMVKLSMSTSQVIKDLLTIENHEKLIQNLSMASTKA